MRVYGRHARFIDTIAELEGAAMNFTERDRKVAGAWAIGIAIIAIAIVSGTVWALFG